jgi:hypothetical protein
MIGHYHGGMKVVAFGMVMQAAVEDGVSGFWSESDAIGFAECNEYGSSCFLVVGEHAVVFVFSFESLFGHCRVTGRRRIKAKAKSKAKQRANSRASDKSVRPTRALPPTGALPSSTSIAGALAFVCDE